MKLLLLSFSFILLNVSAKNCKHAKVISSTCFKGKLELKGACRNFVISMQSKNFDTSLVNASWKSSATSKTYKNVFGLSSRCSFPDSIKEGDEFYFLIDNAVVQNCMVCMIYYPTPPRKLSIRVLNAPCK